MKKNIRRIVAVFCAAAILSAGSMTALAAGAEEYVNVEGTVSSGSKVFNIGKDRDLFSDFKDLMPGDVKTNQITVSNHSSRRVTIYMKAMDPTAEEMAEVAAAHAEKTERNDLLDQIKLTIKSGEDVIFDGYADGRGDDGTFRDSDYGIELGSFAANSQQVLSVTLTLPGAEFDNSFAARFDAVDWRFVAEGTSGGGGGGSTGGGGGGTVYPNTPIPDGEVPLDGGVIIDDTPVPLAPVTGNDGEDNTNILISDGDVPLAGVPKLGDNGIEFYVFGLACGLLLVCGALYVRKRCDRSEK